MSRIFATNLRIDLDTEEGQKAVAYLKGRDRTRFRTYSDTVIAALNAFFDREAALSEDPYLETRAKEDAFLQEIREAVRQGVQASGAVGAFAAFLQNAQPKPVPEPEPEEKISEESFQVAIDFINSL